MNKILSLLSAIIKQKPSVEKEKKRKLLDKAHKSQSQLKSRDYRPNKHNPL